MKVRRTNKGKKESGRNQPQATGPITMTQLRLMLNRCVAEPIVLLGVVGRDDFEPTWTDVRTAFLGGYKAALKDVIELAGGNSVKFGDRMKEGVPPATNSRLPRARQSFIGRRSARNGARDRRGLHHVLEMRTAHVDGKRLSFMWRSVIGCREATCAIGRIPGRGNSRQSRVPSGQEARSYTQEVRA